MLEIYNKLNTDVSMFDEPYSRSLRFKTGHPAKVFNLEKDFHLLDLNPDQKINKFLIQRGLVYFIPMELTSPEFEIFGFILKSVNEKQFLTIKLDGYDYCPLVFGLHDIDKKNAPIMLLEGLKDRMAVRQKYPYVLAYLTGQPSKLLFNYLLRITNRLIFLPDNDKTGKKISLFYKYKKFVKYYSFTKDFGDYWDNYDKMYLNFLDVIMKQEKLA